MNAQIIRSNGEMDRIFPRDGEHFQLEELREAISGGYIEMHAVFTPAGLKMLMFIDEEGKLKNLPENPLATALFQHTYGPLDYIAGDALLCREDQVE